MLVVTAATPAPSPVNPMHCLLMASVVIQNKDPSIAEIGKLAGIYWMGRVNGAYPNANLSQQLGAQVRTMQGTDLKAEAERCDAEMKARGVQMQEAGKALQAQAGQLPK